MTNKQHYKLFCEQENLSLPFSLEYSWWNEVVKNSWDVAVVVKDKKAVAVWPYFLRKKGPWQVISPAYFTPYAGPFINYPLDQKPSTKISYENKIHEELIQQLPKVAAIEQQFPIDFSNGLAFRWNGFQESISYTYILDLSASEEVLWGNLRENIRRQIKKAEGCVQLEEEYHSEKLEELFKGTFAQQKAAYPIGDAGIIDRMADYVQKYKSGKMYFAKEGQEIHAAMLCIHDQKTAYYSIGAAAEAYKNSGAMSYLLWQNIKVAKAAGCQYFNFEGSVIPSIEKFLRAFGGQLTKVHLVSKVNSKSMAMAEKVLR